VLRAQDVSKRYDSPRGTLEILSGVTLSFEAGASAAIMGPSGSGKSTLLYILGALEPPSSGVVTLDDVDPFTLAEHELASFRNQRIGFVFQDHLLLPQCSVLENVLTPTLVDSRRDPAADRLRAIGLLEQVGLEARLEHRPGELSGGERQRVAIARALIRQPRLILCDEPTGNLDRSTADAVANLLLDLHARQRFILIVVTHSTALAGRFAVRYQLEQGRLVQPV
jgi:lipoprotein-releasing system ATP-binding protein